MKSSTSPLATRTVKCLVTGFDKFGGDKANPSETITKKLPSEVRLDEAGVTIIIDRIVLPTAGKRSWLLLKDKLDTDGLPDILLILGQAAMRSAISLERFAMNIRDYRIPDNDKDQPLDQPIDKGARDLLRTTVSLADLLETLQGKGHICEISNYAGSFVCNDVYFQALQIQQRKKALQAVLFVHVPLPKTYSFVMKKNGKKSKKLASGNKLKGLDHAVIEIIKFCAAEKKEKRSSKRGSKHK